ncbi:MAG TPA: antibiotic biosynthesis monooxygenase [Tepidiformaceae bacterium]|jgi:heme-degrading monooxygenase HmoA|nr:antibiotic biosynthesis monooxygenase [Tepidiformaceae bacterium]
MGEVIYFNCFEVAPEHEDDFWKLYNAVNAYMSKKPGYISNRMHRALSPDSRYRFINVPIFESAELFWAAHDDGFKAVVGSNVWPGFNNEGTLCEFVEERTREGMNSLLAAR